MIACLLFMAAWFVVGTVVAFVVGQVIRRRDRQVSAPSLWEIR